KSVDRDWLPKRTSPVVPISGTLPKTGLPSVTLSRLDYRETGSRSSIGSRALTLMFFLTDAAVADFPVTLKISPTYPGFIPESVTIPAGNSSYQISMVVSPVAGSLYRLTATDPYGVTQTLTIYLCFSGPSGPVSMIHFASLHSRIFFERSVVSGSPPSSN